MGSDAPVCPGCGAQLAGAIDDGPNHSRHFVCQGCGGWVIAIAVLRKLVADGVAGQIWNGDEAQTVDGPCAFCRRPMEARQVAAGQAAICKTCQVVWLDRAALAALPAATSPTAVVPEEHEVRCENCGAFAGSPYDERCRYCGTSLGPATKVVVVPAQSQPDAGTGDLALLAHGAGRVVTGAASLLDWFQ